eukprot:NODE_810_length_3750_cov_0.623939.p3 type:complete len:108 gc:universal NODE_810_length_3750_cov_0.623939:1442-1765(+)
MPTHQIYPQPHPLPIEDEEESSKSNVVTSKKKENQERRNFAGYATLQATPMKNVPHEPTYVVFSNGNSAIRHPIVFTIHEHMHPVFEDYRVKMREETEIKKKHIYAE